MPACNTRVSGKKRYHLIINSVHFNSFQANVVHACSNDMLRFFSSHAPSSDSMHTHLPAAPTASSSTVLGQERTATLAGHLPPLPLLCLRILERKPTRPLIRARLATNPSIATREQNTPKRNCSQERRAQRAQAERQHPRLRPHRVAVEGVNGVENCRDSERGEGVGGFGVCVGCCCAWVGRVSEIFG